MTLVNKISRSLPRPIKILFKPIFGKFVYNLQDKMQRRNVSKFYSKFIRKGDLVFDIGANEGQTAEIFLKLGAEVVSVEPNPYCFKILKEKFSGLPNIQILNKGVAAKDGELLFNICRKSSGISTFSDAWTKSERFKKNFNGRKK